MPSDKVLNWTLGRLEDVQGSFGSTYLHCILRYTCVFLKPLEIANLTSSIDTGQAIAKLMPQRRPQPHLGTPTN